MKISDVYLNMVSRTIPKGSYAGQPVFFGGENELAVVTIQTDEGVNGHSFIGSALRGADIYADKYQGSGNYLFITLCI